MDTAVQATIVDRGCVWILEDSPLEAEMVRRALAPSQDVEIFTDGSVVLERIATNKRLPDAIVLDWQLPGISGVEVCRVVRATHDAMSLPILMLTGQADEHDVVEGFAVGANDYVVKPYRMSEVNARVGLLVCMSRLQRAQIRQAHQVSLAAAVGEAITKGKNLEEVAWRCTEAFALHLEALSAEVWEQRDGVLARLGNANGYANANASTNANAELPTKIIQQVVNAQKPFFTDDASELAALGFPAGTCGFAALPLRARDETNGVVAFSSQHPIGDSLPALMTVAGLLALGIARARIEEERALAHARERNARGEAEAANRSKDEFLAMVSHELRTPLNAITGWTTMLLEGTLEPLRAKRALETIERNARSQAQLIDDLLDIGRIVSGKLRVEIGSVDVAAIAAMAVEAVRPAADVKSIALDIRIEEAAGLISGDVARIQQIIWNLLTNAIKFTPNGGRVVLGVRANTTRTEKGIEISVEDTGQGIDAAFLPHVFDRFKQADGSSVRAHGGLGLGLAIVKHIVEIHGGTIEATSKGLGHGALFVVTLPVLAPAEILTSEGTSNLIESVDDDDDDDDDAIPDSLTLASSSASETFSVTAKPRYERPREVEGMRILVVDDEADARDLLRMLLESCMIIVTTVGSAAEAFEVVKSLAIDAMISDIALPGEDGFSLIRRVRMLSPTEGGRTPAIALTAYARLEDRTRALRAGFNSHVAKPVDPSELLAVLASLASLANHRSAVG